MIKELEKLILSKPGIFFPGAETPRALGTLLVKGSLGEKAGRVTLLIFKDIEPLPSLAVKMTRDPGGESLLATEAQALKYLADGFPAEVGLAAPKLLYKGDLCGAPFVAEEAVHGLALGAEMEDGPGLSGGKEAARLGEAAAWLDRLALASRSSGGENKAVRTAEIFRARYAITDAAGKFLDGLKGALAALDRDCPRVFTHGDFSPMNIYFGGKGMRVIDWAESSRYGTPLHDLFFLLTCLTSGPVRAEEEGTRRLDNFSSLFFRGGRRNALALSVVKKSLARLELDGEMLKPLLALFLMERANRDHDVLESQGKRGYMVLMPPFGADASWSDGGLARCGLYARLFDMLAGNPDGLVF